MRGRGPEEILKRIEGRAWRDGLPIIGPKRGMILARTVREVRPRLVLEIGTLIGYSTILMGRELGEDSKIITVEEDAEEAETARENIRRAGLRVKVDVVVGDAIKILPGLEGVFDLVFLDADHGEFREYLRLLEERLRKGAVLFADNAGIYSHRMRDYLSYVRGSPHYESRYLPVDGDGVEISVRL